MHFSRSVLFLAIVLLPSTAAIAAPVSLLPTPRLVLPELRPQQAQSDYGDTEFEEPGENRDPSGPSPGVTAGIVSAMETGIEHCGTYTQAWRIDCLADELDRLADDTPDTGDYAAVKAALRDAAADLNRIATQNADPGDAPRVRASQVDDRRRQTTRPIVPVAPSRVAAANAEATAVVDNLTTTLLRSAATPTARIEFARVAQAVDSSKVLLRSS